MRYTIRPYVGDENFLSKGEIVRRDSKGGETLEGVYTKATMPDTETVLRVKKDQNLVPFIDISEDDLQKAVRAFGLIDDKKEENIITADSKVAIGPFWNHKDLSFLIPNVGTELEVIDFDRTPRDSFWLAVMKEDPWFWVNDGVTERPENLNEVRFIVTPSHMDVEKKPTPTGNTKLSELMELTRIIIKMDRSRKKYILDAIGKSYDDSFNDSDFDDIIVEHLELPDYRVSGQRFYDFVLDVSRKVEAAFDISSLVSEAIKNDTIVLKGDQYYFNNIGLGSSQLEVEKNLFRADMTPTLKKIQKQVKSVK